MYDRNEIALLITSGLCGIATTIAAALVAVTGGGLVASIAPIIAVASGIMAGFLLGERRVTARPQEAMLQQIADLQAATQQHIEIHRAMRFQPEDLHTQIANIQASVASIQRALAMVLTRSYPHEEELIRRELAPGNGR